MNFKTCAICNKGFNDHTSLDLHMQLVHQEDQYQNIDRKRKIANKDEEKKNPAENCKLEPNETINVKVIGKSNDCSECGIIFKSEEECKEHIKEKHNQRYIPRQYKPAPVTVRGLPLNCDLCNEPFNSGCELMKHMHTKHKTKLHHPENCEYCEIKFSSTEALLNHARANETIKDTVMVESIILTAETEHASEMEESDTWCTECTMRCTSEDELDKHVDNAHRAMPPDQKISLKLTGDLTDVLSEIKIPDEEQKKMDHAEMESKDELRNILNSDFSDIKKEGKHGESYKCNHCNFTTSGSRNLRMHNKTMHSKSSQILTCDICKMSARNRGDLVHHMKTKHQDSVKYKTCKFIAASPSYLKVHVKRKHKTETYQCDECSEQFESRTFLAQHKRKHVAAFKCNLCDFKGVSVSGLRHHMINKHLKNKTLFPGAKRDASINITKEAKKSKKSNSPKKEETKSPTNKLPNKESEVIGGSGWSLNQREVKANQMEPTKTNDFEENIKMNKLNIKMLKQNSSEVPEICKPHLPEDYKDSFVHNVLGDGTCGIRCVLAHLGVKHEVEKYSKNLNMFMFRNQPSLETKFYYPLEVKYGPSGKNRTFKNSDGHFEWLKSNPEAIKVWRMCGDIKAVSNQENMNIKVMRLDKNGKLELPIQEYEPDDEYKYEDNNENPKEQRPEMILINKSDHFGLVVKNESVEKKEKGEETQNKQFGNEIIAELQTKIKELEQKMKSNKCDCKEIEQQNESEGSKNMEKFKPIEKPKKNFTERWSCKLCPYAFTTSPLLERHIQNKHSQNKVQESEFRFSRIINCDNCEALFTTEELLKEHERNHHKDDIEMIETDKPICKSAEEDIMDTEDKNRKGKFKCKICNLVQNTKSKLENHMKNHEEDADWLCDGIPSSEECSFQSNDRMLLVQHLKEVGHVSNMLKMTNIEEIPDNTTHNATEKEVVQEIETNKRKCKFCVETFSSTSHLASHRREIHPTSKPCRNIDQCIFGLECYYSHIPIEEGCFRCYQCGEEFKSINEMMLHRKRTHEGVQDCKKFLTNQCTKGSETCWFMHNARQRIQVQNVWESNHVQNSFKNTHRNTQREGNFWPAIVGGKPPDQITTMMMEMKKLLQEMIQIKEEIVSKIN